MFSNYLHVAKAKAKVAIVNENTIPKSEPMNTVVIAAILAAAFSVLLFRDYLPMGLREYLSALFP